MKPSVGSVDNAMETFVYVSLVHPAMFNGYEFEGGRLEVREDRFFHINQARSALGPPRGGRPSGRGGFSGSHASSRSTDNLYNDYAGPSDSMSSRCGGDDFGSGSERLSYSGFSGRAPPTGPYAGRDPIQASPSTQIFVNNVSAVNTAIKFCSDAFLLHVAALVYLQRGPRRVVPDDWYCRGSGNHLGGRPL